MTREIIFETPSLEMFRKHHLHHAAGQDLFPVRKFSKAPLESGWRENDYSCYDWESHFKRGGNAANRLKTTDLIIDIDPRDFKTDSMGNIIDSFDLMCADLGLDFSLFPSVRSGNGGRHIYTTKPADYDIFHGRKEWPGVEFKTFKTYVLAAGSVHPLTGKRYEVDDPFMDLWMPREAPKALLYAIHRRPFKLKPKTTDSLKCSPAKLKWYLSHLDPTDYRDYSKWLKMFFASFDATDGEGVEEFIEWSTSDPLYADHREEILKKWEDKCNAN